MNQANENPKNVEPTKYHRRISAWLRRLVRYVFGFLLFYLITVVAGLIPVHRGFLPAEQGVTIYVSSNAVHADIIVPVTNEIMDWRTEFPSSDFGGNVNLYRYVAIGWGDRGFFLKTPRWEDLRVTTAANAMLWPSDTVMHVQFTQPTESDSCRAVQISNEAYERLVRYVLDSFHAPADARERHAVTYNRYDVFYQAEGSYHLFNTCNCWVGGGLKSCGVTVPFFTPLPRTVLWYLPEPL